MLVADLAVAHLEQGAEARVHQGRGPRLSAHQLAGVASVARWAARDQDNAPVRPHANYVGRSNDCAHDTVFCANGPTRIVVCR